MAIISAGAEDFVCYAGSGSRTPSPFGERRVLEQVVSIHLFGQFSREGYPLKTRLQDNEWQLFWRLI